MDTAVKHEEINLLSRLDRIPITRTTVKIMALLAIVWTVEAFDIGIVGQVILILRKIWKLTPGEIGLLGISSTAGIVLGLYFAGPIIDRFGRKRVLILGVISFSIFTVLGCFFSNLYWIVVMRFVAGLGEGAVFTLPYLMIAEFCGSKRRATLTSTANGVLVMSYVLPNIVGAWALAKFDLQVAWRIPFLVAGLPIIIVYFIAKWLPDSPRWLLQKGRVQEVRSLVERLEREAGLEKDSALLDPGIMKSLAAQDSQQKSSISSVFKRPYLSRMLISGGVYGAWFIFWYIILVYGPVIFSDKGFKMGSAVMFTGAMTFIGGAAQLLFGPLADRYGRKPVVFIGTIVTALGCIFMAEAHLISTLVAACVVTSIVGIGLFPIGKVYIAEQFPTFLRGAGSGVSEAFARLLGGVLAPFYVPFALRSGGVREVFWLTAAAFILAVIPFMIWGRETAGLSVDQTGATTALEQTERLGGQLRKVAAAGATGAASDKSEQ